MTEDGERRVVDEGDSESTRSDSVRTDSGDHLVVVVSATQQSPSHEAAIAPGESVAIAAGVYDDSGPAPVGVSGETLDITVTDPDGGQTPYSATTDTDGSATVTYDLSSVGAGAGTYDLTVTDGVGNSLDTTFDVGYDVLCTSEFGSGNMLMNDETRFEFIAMEGATAVAGLELTLRVVNDDTGGTVVEETKTTDSDGFAGVSFTPQSTVSYTIEADRNGETVESVDVDTVDIIGLGSYEIGRAHVGETHWYGGVLLTANGPAANLDCTLKFYTDYVGGTLFTEKSITTDSHGFFAVEYDLPDDYSENSLVVDAKVADGRQVALDEDYIRVSDPGSGGGSTVNLSADIDAYNYAPGEEATITVETTDDGSPITNQEVNVFLRYDFDGPPIRSETVTTDSNGKATVSVALPGDDYDGLNLGGSAGMSYGGDTYTDSLFGDIDRYEYGFNYPDITPGGSGTYSIDVTDKKTDSSVEGIPFWFDAVYSGGLVGSFATGKLVSGADGTDSTSVSIPADLGFDALANNINRYWGENFAAGTNVAYPGSLSTNDTLVAGESAELSFSVPNDVSLTGIAFGEANNVPFGTTISSTGTFSVTIPSTAEAGDYVNLSVWAIDDQGQKYRAEEYIEVTAGSIDVSASGETGVSVGGEATLSLSAQKVDQLTVEKVWTDWNLTSTTTSGGAVTNQIASAGEVNISYDSVQTSADPSLTMSLPERYVGGTYRLTVSASNDSGGSAQDTAQITIQ